MRHCPLSSAPAARSGHSSSLGPGVNATPDCISAPSTELTERTKYNEKWGSENQETGDFVLKVSRLSSPQY